MKKTLLRGALVPACHICNLPAPCPRHGAREAGADRGGVPELACQTCGYHVCACVTEDVDRYKFEFRSSGPDDGGGPVYALPGWLLTTLRRELPQRVPLGWVVKRIGGVDDSDRSVYVVRVAAEDPRNVEHVMISEMRYGEFSIAETFVERLVGKMQKLVGKMQKLVGKMQKLVGKLEQEASEFSSKAEGAARLKRAMFPEGFPTRCQVAYEMPHLMGIPPSVFAWKDDAGSVLYAAEIKKDGKTYRAKRSFLRPIDTIPTAVYVASLLAEDLEAEVRYALEGDGLAGAVKERLSYFFPEYATVLVTVSESRGMVRCSGRVMFDGIDVRRWHVWKKGETRSADSIAQALAGDMAGEIAERTAEYTFPSAEEVQGLLRKEFLPLAKQTIKVVRVAGWAARYDAELVRWGKTHTMWAAWEHGSEPSALDIAKCLEDGLRESLMGRKDD